jgi:hypothetical protein
VFISARYYVNVKAAGTFMNLHTEGHRNFEAEE